MICSPAVICQQCIHPPLPDSKDPIHSHQCLQKAPNRALHHLPLLTPNHLPQAELQINIQYAVTGVQLTCSQDSLQTLKLEPMAIATGPQSGPFPPSHLLFSARSLQSFKCPFKYIYWGLTTCWAPWWMREAMMHQTRLSSREGTSCDSGGKKVVYGRRHIRPRDSSRETEHRGQV